MYKIKGKHDILNTKNFLQINFLKSVPLLSELPSVVLARLGDVLETELFTQGEHIVREGTAGDTFYILASGEVRVTIRGETVRQMGQGEYFGEQVQCTQRLYDRDSYFQALLKTDLRTASVMAISETVECLALDRE